jgi:hypothetical protein
MDILGVLTKLAVQKFSIFPAGKEKSLLDYAKALLKK